MSPWRVNRVNDLVLQRGSRVRPVQATVLHEPTWGWHAARTTFPPAAGQYSWPTRHDAGRWHVARQVNLPIGGAGGHGYTGAP